MRSMQKAIDDYKKKFTDSGNHNKGGFWASDMWQIKEISNSKIWECIQNALMAGFMVGYRYGKKENKNNNRV